MLFGCERTENNACIFIVKQLQDKSEGKHNICKLGESIQLSIKTCGVLVPGEGGRYGENRETDDDTLRGKNSGKDKGWRQACLGWIRD